MFILSFEVVRPGQLVLLVAVVRYSVFYSGIPLGITSIVPLMVTHLFDQFDTVRNVACRKAKDAMVPLSYAILVANQRIYARNNQSCQRSVSHKIIGMGGGVRLLKSAGI
ncbi:unnamed protein product [Ceratitis capitata]|uniref:(Mediterranean fruit fly) hypothetical protein n=1 Tax=Ceratitis capitata TaxID=7213 RepID=A0A811URJ0_CERCA|nr:unnamed protein product [Ceratitis capitata]